MVVRHRQYSPYHSHCVNCSLLSGHKLYHAQTKISCQKSGEVLLAPLLPSPCGYFELLVECHWNLSDEDWPFHIAVEIEKQPSKKGDKETASLGHIHLVVKCELVFIYRNVQQCSTGRYGFASWFITSGLLCREFVSARNWTLPAALTVTWCRWCSKSLLVIWHISKDFLSVCLETAG